MKAASPAWIRLPYTAFVIVLVPVYWVENGPGNFLWFSDIAVFAVLIALWTGHRLLPSMMAIGVLPLEAFWTVDFLSGGRFGLAAYMFDPAEPIHVRILSLFHLFLPPILLWMLVRWRYDPRALAWQTALAWVVLPASWLLTDPAENINWVHSLGDLGQVLPDALYLALYMALLPLLVYAPMHLILKRILPP